MHFPLRGEAIVRTRELRDVAQATLDQSKREFVGHERVLRRVAI